MEKDLFDWNSVVRRFQESFESTFSTSKKVNNVFCASNCFAYHINLDVSQFRLTLTVYHPICALSMARGRAGQV